MFENFNELPVTLEQLIDKYFNPQLKEEEKEEEDG